MNIAELLNKKFVEGEYALEIEVEGRALPYVENRYWVTTQDGSLRGEAQEYISNGPQLKAKLPTAIDTLLKHFEDNGSVLNMSYRTSVHVHMNILNLTLEELIALVYLYYVYEELLVKFCGDGRVGNRFSLRLRDAEGILDNVLHAFKDNAGVLRYHAGSRQRAEAYGNEVRYSALNLAAIPKFGSLEFRSMRGTTDKDVLLMWVDLLDCLKQAAQRFKTARAIKHYMDNVGVTKLSEEVFGERLNFIAFENWQNEVAYNASLACAIPFEIAVKEVKDIPVGAQEALVAIEANVPAAPRLPRRAAVRNRPAAAIVDEILQERANMINNIQPDWNLQ